MDICVSFDELNVEHVEDIGTIEILMLKGEKGDTGYPTDAQVAEAVDDWLDDHPEATTTVQDKSIGAIKLTDSLYEQILNAYPTDKVESAPIATFSDGADNVPVKSLSVDLEPVQDLNGYNNPWPAGGGKNKLSSEWQSGSYGANGNKINDNTKIRTASAINVSANTTYTLSFAVARSDGGLVCYYTDDAFISRASIVAVNPTFTTPANCTRVTFAVSVESDGTTPKAQLEQGSSATAWSPYSNICPISGHTEVNVTRTGKNLFDVSKYLNLYSYEAADYVESSYTCRIIQIAPNTTYTVSINTTAQTTPIILLSNKRKVNDSGFFDCRLAQATKTFTTDDTGCLYIGVYRNSSTDAVSARLSALNLQIEYGNTATAYEPYTGQTYNIPLGQTVYGGTLNVGTGVLTIDRACVTLNGSESISVKNTGTANWYYSFDTVLSSAEAKNTVNDISSDYPRASITNGNTNQGFTSSGPWIRVRWGAEDTVANYKVWLANNPLQVCYFLATPTTVQLTATQVSTLLGANNIFADAGEVSVTYRADTGLYIDKKLAQALNA